MLRVASVFANPVTRRAAYGPWAALTLPLKRLCRKKFSFLNAHPPQVATETGIRHVFCIRLCGAAPKVINSVKGRSNPSLSEKRMVILCLLNSRSPFSKSSFLIVFRVLVNPSRLRHTSQRLAVSASPCNQAISVTLSP